MMHVVVRPFAYAANGYTLENLNVGDKRDFGASADGLLAAGLIAPEDAKIEVTVVAEPQAVAQEAEPEASEAAEEVPAEEKPVRRTRK